MRTLLLAAGLFLAPALIGCSAEVTTTSHAASQTLTAGCGACTYHMEGAEGCPLAVEVDGQPMLVTGSDFSAMDNGLCLDKAQVEISGEVQGDKFAATSVKLVE